MAASRRGSSDPQVIIGIDEEFEIRKYFLELEAAQVGVPLQPVEKAATPGFKGHDRINARFAASHPHDFQQRPFVKLVVDLIFVNKEQIGNEREIKPPGGER